MEVLRVSRRTFLFRRTTHDPLIRISDLSPLREGGVGANREQSRNAPWVADGHDVHPPQPGVSFRKGNSELEHFYPHDI